MWSLSQNDKITYHVTLAKLEKNMFSRAVQFTKNVKWACTIPKSIGTWVRGEESVAWRDKAITISTNKDRRLGIILL